MTASDSTPSKGKSADGSIDWESHGREVVAERLELRKSEVVTAIGHLSHALRSGEDPSVRRIQKAARLVRQLDYAMTELEAAAISDDVDEDREG